MQLDMSIIEQELDKLRRASRRMSAAEGGAAPQLHLMLDVLLPSPKQATPWPGRCQC